MIKITVKINRKDAETAFQTSWDDSEFRETATELLHDLTQQISDETIKAAEEMGNKLEQAKMRRKLVEGLFKLSSLNTVSIDLQQKLKEITIVFYDKVDFTENIIEYEIEAVNAADLTDYTKLTGAQLDDLFKDLPFFARMQVKAVGGVRNFLEGIFQTQSKIAEIYYEELRAQFPTSDIKSEVVKKSKEAKI